MKTPKEFDYDMWTANDGSCFIRVKATGEVSKVSSEVMRYLRAEEKRLRREISPKKADIKHIQNIDWTYEIRHPLSLDAESESDEEGRTSWLREHHNMEDEIIALIDEDMFIAKLTPRQASVYQACIVGGLKKSEYAKLHGVSAASVTKVFRQIQAAAKKYFHMG